MRMGQDCPISSGRRTTDAVLVVVPQAVTGAGWPLPPQPSLPGSQDRAAGTSRPSWQALESPHRLPANWVCGRAGSSSARTPWTPSLLFPQVQVPSSHRYTSQEMLEDRNSAEIKLSPCLKL